MIWRFGLFDSTFEPLLPTHWALLVALGLPPLLGMLAALFPPKRAWPVLLASVPVLASGLMLLSAYDQAGLLRWQWKLPVSCCRCV
ncbi:hypothetical protein HORIV_49980 [Vreelandella olivaria]|uniref:NADH dehydrogenase subunit 4 n=1 Tax=Vreelandella olivaria TaxID=390919 RepID=A0ABM7GPI4_9GAMM|nr:hypothetical protein HORIV_49980 [Halomonas olivaria]